VTDLMDGAAQTLRGSSARDRSVVRLPPRGRLLATGDLHDNPIHLAKIIRLSRLDASPDHHVVLHEMIHGGNLINGMDFSHRMLCRVAELALRFPNQVHPLLANHELAQLTGKGVSKGAGDSVALFNAGLQYVFATDGRTCRGHWQVHRLDVAGHDRRCGWSVRLLRAFAPGAADDGAV